MLEANLAEFNLNRGWLEEEVLRLGYRSLEDVYPAEPERDASLFIISRHEGRDRSYH